MQSEFARGLYRLAKAIPRGQVASYGQLALMAGHPRGARIAGCLMASCQDPTVPCHRVVKRDGALCEGEFGPLQRELLLGEGVSFLRDGRVDMERHRWRPEK